MFPWEIFSKQELCQEERSTSLFPAALLNSGSSGGAILNAHIKKVKVYVNMNMIFSVVTLMHKVCLKIKDEKQVTILNILDFAKTR